MTVTVITKRKYLQLAKGSEQWFGEAMLFLFPELKAYADMRAVPYVYINLYLYLVGD
jgi:hypothetical protein